MNNILDKINSTGDVKKLDHSELNELCREIRAFLIENVSKTGGHLASNLGIVELTVAIERVFDTEKDRILFDVGHQSYVHKLLTGRKALFPSLRKFEGMSGFPKPSESKCDAFIAGHASDSISLALGMARARTLKGENYNVAAVIGDGAMTGGLSYEGFNNAGQSGEPMIVILNDNGMSITRNVGGIARILSRMRSKPGYYHFKLIYRKILKHILGGERLYAFNHRIKTAVKKAVLNCSFFEEMGFHYLGPIDGHDIKQLEYMLEHAKALNEPVILHVVTKKGMGYPPAEDNPGLYHGVPPFNVHTGVSGCGSKSFSTVFGEKILAIAEKNDKICAITAAMKSGTGLTEFAEKFPDRFFDEGIAEGHAAVMAAGMAKQGIIPVFAVYSTFLQRSYDMLIHDVAILGLHVVFAVDRAGIVGADGETHQGIFDVGFLRQIPGMTVYSPASFAELDDMLEEAISLTGPVAVRYPRGCEGKYKAGGSKDTKIIRSGSDITLITYGTMINNVLEVSDMLKNDSISAEVIKLGVIKPLNISLIEESVKKTSRVAIIEECTQPGCVGEALLCTLSEARISADSVLINLGDEFVTHGSINALYEHYGLDAAGIYWKIKFKIFGEDNEEGTT